MKRLLVVVVIAMMAAFVLPNLAHADASIVQDSCQVWDENGNTYVRIWFSVVNFSLPTSVCDLHFTPEPLPAPPECQMLNFTAPPGWSGFLSPLGGADFFANTPADCIAAGTIKGGFSIVLDPGFCCYVVDFTDATGAVIVSQEECFTLCGKVANELRTWGKIKDIYK